MRTEGGSAIAVYSQFTAGHIPAYHQHYLEGFRRRGCRVLDLPASARRVPEKLLGRLLRAVRPGEAAWIEAAWRLRRGEVRSGIRAEAAFLVYGDLGFVHPAASPARIPRRFPWPWACVLNGPRVIRGDVHPYPSGERALSAANCRAVVVTDPSFVPPCRESWPGRRVLSMPEIARTDPPQSSGDLLRFKAFAAGRRVVGLLGVIGAKKNVSAFLRLARQAQQALPGVVFVISGDFGPGSCPAAERPLLEADLRSLPPNCRFFPAPVPDGSTFNGWVDACDVVWVAYRDVPYRSNVLTKAAYFRRPVLVSPGHVMARHVGEFGLGEIVEPDQTGEALAALTRLLHRSPGGPGFDRFNRMNSPERLDETVAELIPALCP